MSAFKHAFVAAALLCAQRAAAVETTQPEIPVTVIPPGTEIIFHIPPLDGKGVEIKGPVLPGTLSPCPNSLQIEIPNLGKFSPLCLSTLVANLEIPKEQPHKPSWLKRLLHHITPVHTAPRP